MNWPFSETKLFPVAAHFRTTTFFKQSVWNFILYDMMYPWGFIIKFPDGNLHWLPEPKVSCSKKVQSVGCGFIRIDNAIGCGTADEPEAKSLGEGEGVGKAGGGGSREESPSIIYVEVESPSCCSVDATRRSSTIRFFFIGIIMIGLNINQRLCQYLTEYHYNHHIPFKYLL